jgi:hypothetical protein
VQVMPVPSAFLETVATQKRALGRVWEGAGVSRHRLAAMSRDTDRPGSPAAPPPARRHSCRFSWRASAHRHNIRRWKKSKLLRAVDCSVVICGEPPQLLRRVPSSPSSSPRLSAGRSRLAKREPYRWRTSFRGLCGVSDRVAPEPRRNRGSSSGRKFADPAQSEGSIFRQVL